MTTKLTVRGAQGKYAQLIGPAWEACAGLGAREAKVLTELETLQREHPHLERPLDDGLTMVWAAKLAESQAKVESLLATGSGSNPVARLRLRDEEKFVDYWTRKLAVRRRQLQEVDQELES